MSETGGHPPEPPEPFTDTSWIESSRRKLRYRHVALGLWMISFSVFLFYGLSARLSFIVQLVREVGVRAAIPRIWTTEALFWLGLEAAFSLFAFGVLLALAWWKKPPEVPEPPTVLTWIIFFLGVWVVLAGELLGIITTEGWTAPIWFIISFLHSFTSFSGCFNRGLNTGDTSTADGFHDKQEMSSLDQAKDP